ncbi:class I SAM-dependent methyltransferase [Litoreibacter roseus]|uniref:class I SAM-dependent methyltransferase n=1 Tax=Litoreibacter roseus TaxID=2601869 RepID=UPI001357193A|nr:class I SAM-dependent methyltransferase [Litoreibacter roseus]
MALDRGLLSIPPAGRVGLINAPGSIDICGIQPSRLIASQSFFPDHAQLLRRGIGVDTTFKTKVAVSIVHCHRSKDATLALIASAMDNTAEGGLIILDGDKTDGVESVIKTLRYHVALEGSYSKAHGKLVWFIRPLRPPNIDEWRPKPAHLENGFTTVPGIFSADGADRGSRLLAETLPELSGKVADLGAGWGYLSRHILLSPDVVRLDLIEADHTALEMAKVNVPDQRAVFKWTDAREVEGSYDVVVTNPPFHTSRQPDPVIGQAFLKRAAAILQPKGEAWIVANRNLPYEQTLGRVFKDVDTVLQQNGYKIFRARKPKTANA